MESSKEVEQPLPPVTPPILTSSITNTSTVTSEGTDYDTQKEPLNDELDKTLERQQHGRAAVVLVRVIMEDDGIEEAMSGENNKIKNQTIIKYMVQRKSKDYAIPEFQSAICLLGGNAKVGDINPFDTLKRELQEELGTTTPLTNPRSNPNTSITMTNETTTIMNDTSSVWWNNRDDFDLVGYSLHSFTADLVRKPQPYSFLCALFITTIRSTQLRSLLLSSSSSSILNTSTGSGTGSSDINEGSVVLLYETELMTEQASYAWGYGDLLSHYFSSHKNEAEKTRNDTKVNKKIMGVTVRFLTWGKKDTEYVNSTPGGLFQWEYPSIVTTQQ